MPNLVLSRDTADTPGPAQQIRIGDDVTVTLVSVHRNRARLAVTAPKDTPIMRAELGTTPKLPADPLPDRALIDAIRRQAWQGVFGPLFKTNRLTVAQAGDIATAAAMEVDRRLVEIFTIPETAGKPA